MSSRGYIVSESSTLMLSVFEIAPGGSQTHSRIKMDIDAQPIRFQVIGTSPITDLPAYAKEQIDAWLIRKCEAFGIAPWTHHTFTSIAEGLIPLEDFK